MQRLSFTRPNQKVRGAKRHLKALDQWASGFDEFIPKDWCSERYVDLRLPVLDRLVDPPTAKPEWQVHAIKAMFTVLHGLNTSRPSEYSGVPIDLIITWPNLSGSMITLFFDKAYHQSFYESDGDWQKRIPQELNSEDIPFNVPDNISAKKVKFMNRDSDGEETTDWYIEDWYVCSICNS